MSVQQKIAETDSLSADLAGAIGIVDQLRRGLLGSTFGIQVACDWVETLLREDGKRVRGKSRIELYEFIGVTPEELAEWKEQARQAGLQRFRQVTGRL